MSFVVVTRTSFNPEMKESMIEFSNKALPIFKQQAGLEAIKMHISHDGTHTMTYFIWESKQYHEACMASADWTEFNKEWEELMQSGKIQFELNTYEQI